MSNNLKIGFALLHIKTEQFAILEENYHKNSITGLRTGFDFRLNTQHKTVACIGEFVFMQESKPFLKLAIACHFGIKEESWNELAVEDKKTITFPKDFATHMALITTGTARGVLFAKAEHTEFAKYFIPTLDITKAIQDDLTFEMVN
jgi:hypothetical protein